MIIPLVEKVDHAKYMWCCWKGSPHLGRLNRILIRVVTAAAAAVACRGA
jgi:hypothetical protein